MTEEIVQAHRAQRMLTMRIAKQAREFMSYRDFLTAVENGLGEPELIVAAQALQARGELTHLMHWVWFPINRSK